MISKRGNALVTILAVLAIVFASATGYLLWQNQQRNEVFTPSQSTTSSPSLTNNSPKVTNNKTVPEGPQKFVFHEEIVVTKPDNFGIGTFKNQFSTFDIPSKSKQVIGETTLNEDRADSYRLYQDKYILTLSPKGNSVTAINKSDVAPSFPEGYDRGFQSPSGKKMVVVNFPQTTSATVSLTVVNNSTNGQTTYPIQNKDLVPQFIGWSSNEKYAYYILIETHIGDPGQPLYQFNTETGGVKVMPRDSSVGKFTNLQIGLDSQNDTIYYAADNGLFKQAINSQTATKVPLINIVPSQGYSVLAATKSPTGYIALSDIHKVILKNITSGEEIVVAEYPPSDQAVRLISLAGNYLVFAYNSWSKTGSGDFSQVGYIYNIPTKELIKFAEHKANYQFGDGRIQFIDWL